MGAALPVISLAVSAAGTAAGIASQAQGGTMYTADSKAKYKADQEALRLAEYNMKQKEALLAEERSAAQAYAKFAHEQQIIQLNAQSEAAALELQNQWQQINYNKEINKQVKGMERFMSDASLEQARQGAEKQYENARRQLGIDKFSRESDLAFSERGRQMKEQALQAQGLQLDLQGQGLNLNEAQLAQQQAEGRQQIGAQYAQLGLQEQAQAQERFGQEQGLASQESQIGSNLNLQLGQADEQKRQRINQLLQAFAGNERDYAKYQAQLAKSGFASGNPNLGYDMVNNLATQQAEQEALSGASNAKTAAGIQAQYAQGGVNQARANLAAQAGLNKQAAALQRFNLGQSEQNLGIQGALSQQGINQQRQGLNLARQDLALNQYQIDLDRQYDVFSKSLLPDLRSQQVLQEAEQQRVNSLFGVSMQQAGENFGRTMQDVVEDRQYEQDRYDYKAGLESIPTNYAYQRKAADANYLSSLGSSSTVMEAQLANLAANQHGLLSSLGQGLANGTNTGYRQSSMTGFANALGAVGGFMGQLQGYLGSRNMGSSSSSGSGGTMYSGFPKSTSNIG